MKHLITAAIVFAAAATLAKLVERYQRPRWQYTRKSEKAHQRALCWREN